MIEWQKFYVGEEFSYHGTFARFYKYFVSPIRNL